MREIEYLKHRDIGILGPSLMGKQLNKAVFIDKDGTLIPDIPYNVDPSRISLENNMVQGLKYLQSHGYLLVIISNQSGIAQGYFTEEEFIAAQKKIEQLLKSQAIRLNGFYYCPHHPDGIIKEYSFACDCRKPESGLLLRASSDLNIDLSSSWMLGDILNDVEAGNKAGCRTILIDNGNETEWLMTPERRPNYIVKTINDAAGHIIRENISISVNHDKKVV